MCDAFALMLCSGLILKGFAVHTVQGKHGDTSDSIKFLVLGDWGGYTDHPYTTALQIRVAQQMAVKAKEENVDFIMAVGDNFYLEGVNSIFDTRFKITFEEVYHQESLQVPWYVIAGNHDYYGSVEAQIIYSKLSHRWNFPDYFYKETKILPSGKVMDILFIDTYILCGPTHPTPFGNRLFGPLYYSWAETEWEWIEANLKKSTADYLLVVGHYPVYSVSTNGPSKILLDRLEPLLYKHHVTAYLSGHDHNLQHIQTTKDEDKMDYFIIGSGSFVDQFSDVGKVPKNSLKYFFADSKDVGGFAFLELSDTSLKFVFVDSEGKERYLYNMQPRK